MFEITFWRAIFIIGALMIIILKFRNGLDITKTLRAGIIAVILSFIANIALVNLGLISYNPDKLASPVFGVSLFQQLSAGLIAMIMVHFAPENRKTLIPYIATVALIIDCIVFISVELDVIRFIRWDYIANFIFDAVALGVIYYLYELSFKKNKVAIT